MPQLYSETKDNFNKGFVSKKLFLIVTIFLTVLTLALLALFFVNQNKIAKLNQQLKNAQVNPNGQQDEVKELVSKIGKLIILPANETPTIATVTDLEKLKDKTFFEKAQLGDKVLIYMQEKKAILYRPSTNQIIELAPLLDNNTPGTPTTLTTPSSGN